MIFKLGVFERVRYLIERMLAGGALPQLLVVVAIVCLVTLLGGFAAYLYTPVEDTLFDELWWAFLRLTDPGYLGDDSGGARRFLSTLLTVAGYVLFMGTLVAIMTQWLFRQMRNLEQGLTPVTFQNHRVILGWTTRTVPVISELLAYSSKGSASQRIAVLAEDITQGPAEIIRTERWRSADRRRVVLRCGSTLNPEHLHRVGRQRANSILIPSRGHNAESVLSADADVIKMLLSLDAATKTMKERPRVVAELMDASKIPIALHTYKGPLQIVPGDLIIGRILARGVLYNGMLAAVKALLLQAGQPQLVPSSYPKLAGTQWRDVFGYFTQATPCGVVRHVNGKREAMLAPKPDYVISADDHIIMLVLGNEPAPALDKPRKRLALKNTDALGYSAPVERRKILCLGWSNKVPMVLEELAREPHAKFQVTLVSSLSVEEREQDLANRLRIDWPGQLKFIQGDFTQQRLLVNLQPEQYDTVMLFSSDRLGSGEEADARSVVGLMMLDYLLNKLARPEDRPYVVVELNDPSNEVYVNHAQSDVIVGSMIVSHVMAQVALYPSLRVVYDELLSSQGARLNIRYLPVSLHKQLSIGELQQFVLGENAVLLGVNPAGEDVFLNPRPEQRFTFTSNSQLIVIEHQD